MERTDLILISEVCAYHHIPDVFVLQLQEAGLIEIVIEEEQSFLQLEQLSDLEKLIRMHTDLDINLEGIEAIGHLLKRIETMQHELRSLQRRLRLYEAGE